VSIRKIVSRNLIGRASAIIAENQSFTMGEAQEIAKQAFSFLDAWEIEHYVCAEAMKRFPELLTWVTLRA